MKVRLTKVLSRRYRGARWSEEYGSHPGTVWLVAGIGAGCVAGSDRDPIWGPVQGACVMTVLFGPLWLRGCWNRGRSQQPAGRRDAKDGGSEEHRQG